MLSKRGNDGSGWTGKESEGQRGSADTHGTVRWMSSCGTDSVVEVNVRFYVVAMNPKHQLV